MKGGEKQMRYTKPELLELGNAYVLIQGGGRNGSMEAETSSGSYEVDE